MKITIKARLHKTFFSSSMFAPGVSMVEVESLKGQVKEWKEKYETIRLKRQVCLSTSTKYY